MKMLFLIHEIDAPSHTWARRMIHVLGSNISEIVTTQANAKKHYHSIPVYDIQSRTFFEKITTKFLHIFGKKSNITEIQRFKKIISIRKPDIILINFAHLALLYSEALIQFKKPILVHCHGADITWDIRNHEYPDRKLVAENYKQRLLDLPVNYSFIANSNYTRLQLESIGIDPTKIIVKYFGIKPPIARKENIFNDMLTILYLGRLIDCKGPHLVIEAFIKACDWGLKAKLIIAGDGPLMVTCQLLRASSPYSSSISIIGAVNDQKAIELYQEADIFTAHNCMGILTRQEEAFGVTILEAMSNSLPIITGNSGGPKETIIHDETGLLVEPFNTSEHAKAFLKLAQDPGLRHHMGIKGLERVKMHFNETLELEKWNYILSNTK